MLAQGTTARTNVVDVKDATPEPPLDVRMLAVGQVIFGRSEKISNTDNAILLQVSYSIVDGSHEVGDHYCGNKAQESEAIMKVPIACLANCSQSSNWTQSPAKIHKYVINDDDRRYHSGSTKQSKLLSTDYVVASSRFNYTVLHRNTENTHSVATKCIARMNLFLTGTW